MTTTTTTEHLSEQMIREYGHVLSEAEMERLLSISDESPSSRIPDRRSQLDFMLDYNTKISQRTADFICGVMNTIEPDPEITTYEQR
jgi:hypothetical protein